MEWYAENNYNVKLFVRSVCPIRRLVRRFTTVNHSADSPYMGSRKLRALQMNLNKMTVLKLKFCISICQKLTKVNPDKAFRRWRRELQRAWKLSLCCFCATRENRKVSLSNLSRKVCIANVFFFVLFCIILETSCFYASYDIMRIWSSHSRKKNTSPQTEQNYAFCCSCCYLYGQNVSWHSDSL